MRSAPQHEPATSNHRPQPEHRNPKKRGRPKAPSLRMEPDGSAFLTRLRREDGHELFDLGALAFRALDRVFPMLRNALNNGEFLLAGLALVFVRRHGVLLLD